MDAEAPIWNAVKTSDSAESALSILAQHAALSRSALAVSSSALTLTLTRHTLPPRGASVCRVSVKVNADEEKPRSNHVQRCMLSKNGQCRLH